MHDYLIFVLIVLGANLMPAFGPPSWSLIVLTMLGTNGSAPALIVLGALAAATGRLLLALATRGPGRYWFNFWTAPTLRSAYITIAFAAFGWLFVVTAVILRQRYGLLRRRAVASALVIGPTRTRWTVFPLTSPRVTRAGLPSAPANEQPLTSIQRIGAELEARTPYSIR